MPVVQFYNFKERGNRSFGEYHLQTNTRRVFPLIEIACTRKRLKPVSYFVKSNKVGLLLRSFPLERLRQLEIVVLARHGVVKGHSRITRTVIERLKNARLRRNVREQPNRLLKISRSKSFVVCHHRYYREKTTTVYNFREGNRWFSNNSYSAFFYKYFTLFLFRFACKIIADGL